MIYTIDKHYGIYEIYNRKSYYGIMIYTTYIHHGFHDIYNSTEYMLYKTYTIAYLIYTTTNMKI